MEKSTKLSFVAALLLLSVVLSAMPMGSDAQYVWIGKCTSPDSCRQQCIKLGYDPKDVACEPDIEKPFDLCGCHPKGASA